MGFETVVAAVAAAAVVALGDFREVVAAAELAAFCVVFEVVVLAEFAVVFETDVLAAIVRGLVVAALAEFRVAAIALVAALAIFFVA